MPKFTCSGCGKEISEGCGKRIRGLIRFCNECLFGKHKSEPVEDAQEQVNKLRDEWDNPSAKRQEERGG